MKTLLTMAAAVAVMAVASPAFAQSTQGQSARAARDAYAQAQPRVRTVQRHRVRARAAFAAVPGQDGRIHSTNPSHDVYTPSGTYLGSDPDPFIRDSLIRDSHGNYWR